MQILAPDLSATEEVDLLKMRLESTKINAEFVEKNAESVEEKEEAREALAAALEGLEKHSPNGGTPTAVIGHIPPRVFTSIRYRSQILSRDGFNYRTATLEQLEEFTEIARAAVRWGLKGHRNFGCDYATDEREIGGRKYKVASEEDIDAIEFNGLLELLYYEILRFNRLDESKKKPSSPNAGTTPVDTTAKSANESPS